MLPNTICPVCHDYSHLLRCLLWTAWSSVALNFGNHFCISLSLGIGNAAQYLLALVVTYRELLQEYPTVCSVTLATSNGLPIYVWRIVLTHVIIQIYHSCRALHARDHIYARICILFKCGLLFAAFLNHRCLTMLFICGEDGLVELV